MRDTQIANFLLDIKAFKINVNEPFVWTSGIRSPIYCDCRIINSHVSARNAVISKFTDLINKHFIGETSVIAGVASGGISYGALIADRLSLPFIYVREERKKHGLEKQIEGDFTAGDKVILIEDHISTGGSSIKAARVLNVEGLKIVCLLSIMTYGFIQAENNFKQAGINYDSLCDLETVLSVASEKGIINAKDVQQIIQFSKSPKDWRP